MTKTETVIRVAFSGLPVTAANGLTDKRCAELLREVRRDHLAASVVLARRALAVGDIEVAAHWIREMLRDANGTACPNLKSRAFRIMNAFGRYMAARAAAA